MTEALVIRGQATLGYVDHFRIWRRALLTIYIVLMSFITALFFGIWLALLSPRQFDAAAADPLAAIGRAIGDVWGPVVILGLIMPPILIASNAWKLKRVAMAHRLLAYEADAARLTVADAANFRLEMPWSAVSAVRRDSRLVTFHIGRRLRRHALVRAFSEKDVEQIVSWARSGAKST